MEAFELAVRLGAEGLESDAWITSDGVVVLDHDGLVGRRPRRRSIGQVTRRDLPEHIPTLNEFYEAFGSDVELSLDVKDDAAVGEIIACARDAGAEDHLWLCHPSREALSSWRPLSPAVHLVESTRVSRMGSGPEIHVARSSALGIEVINLHHSDWTGGLIALVHRFGLLAFGWDAQHERVLDELLDSGIDGVFSDHVDRMVDALGRV